MFQNPLGRLIQVYGTLTEGSPRKLGLNDSAWRIGQSHIFHQQELNDPKAPQSD